MIESFPRPESKFGRFGKFFEFLKKAAVIGMIGLSTSQGAEGRAGTYIGHHGDAKFEHIDEGERKIVSDTEIQAMILRDESERMFLGTSEGLYEIGGGKDESGLITFEDVQRLIDQGERSPILAHTHPVSVYDNAGYSPESINRMRDKKETPAPMPPSLTDIIGAIDSAEHFSDQDVELRGRVYDPTGVWEYKIRPDAPAVKLFTEFMSNMNSRVEASLTAADKEIMKNLGINDVHPSKRIDILKSNPATRSIGEKIEVAGSDYLESIPDQDKETLEKFAELEMLCVNLAGAQLAGHDPGQVNALIQEYIKASLAAGVQISYVPTK